MATVSLRTHPSWALVVRIPDIGLGIAASGAEVLEFNTVEEIRDLVDSEDLLFEATTGMPALAGSPKIIVADGDDGDIAPAAVLSYLISAHQVTSGAYSELIRDAAGDVPPDVGGGTGITEPVHEGFNTLAHQLARDGYTELSYGPAGPVLCTVWDSVSKLKKVREYSATYTDYRVTQLVVREYDLLGALVKTVTETYTYDAQNIHVINATATES